MKTGSSQQKALLAGSWKWALVLAGAALYLLLANDSRHHWHEWRHLYSASNYSVDQLARGEFDPGPPPERSAAEVGAWYWGQLGHEAFLREGVGLLGQGLVTARVLGWLYGVAMLLTAVIITMTLRRLPITVPPELVGGVVLFSPLGLYLGFKLMGEVPALFFAALACLLLTASLDAPQRSRRVIALGACAVTLALTFLFKVFLPLYFLGFAAALAVAFPQFYSRKQLATHVLSVMAGAALLAGLAGVLHGVALGDWPHIYAFFRGYRQPQAASLFGILTAGSLLYVLAALAPLAGSQRARDLRFFAAWLAGSTLPVLALATNFVESRYLTVGLAAFAGLVALGLVGMLDRLQSRFRSVRWRKAAFVAILPLIPIFGVATQPFMPFEMNSSELVKAARLVWADAPDAAVLLPWNYTDYHFLAFAYPDRPIYLVQSAVDEHGKPYRDPAWERRMGRIYGESFVPGPEQLRQVGNREKVYIGHGILPPFSNLSRLATTLGASWVVERLEAMEPRVHISESWMWIDPRIHLEPTARVGEYRVFAVGTR